MSSKSKSVKRETSAPRSSARKVRFESQIAARKRKRLAMLIGAPVGIALVVVGILIAVNSGGGDSTDAHPAVVAVATIDPAIPTDGLTIGSPDAPVKITEYGDYQCPFCTRFAEDAFPPLLAEYIATGKVQFTYIPMSFLGDESVSAVEAALIANDQGKFWTMHETIYANHDGENEGAYSDARLRTMAELSGLDMDAYNTSMSDATYKDDVTKYAAQAQADGVSSTPSLVLNGSDPMSYTSWPALKEQIDALLPE